MLSHAHPLLLPMDDSVLAQFQSTFLVSGEVNDPHKAHPHHSLYKFKKEGYGSQEARRHQFMAAQQSRRRDFADLARRIAEGGEVSGESDGEMEDDGGAEEVDEKGSEAKPQSSQEKRRQRYPYRNQLMLSEWLVDTPTDFEKDWLAVVVPIGRRSLIVSARKTTYAYSRSGGIINNFPSLLPGGSKHTHRLCRDYCILDCVFYESTQSYYILDVMCWGGHPVYDSDTEFRTFWKEQKCKEFSEISTYSRVNPLPFHNLLYHACTKESLAKILADTPPYQVDGVLFIHKECRYIIGRSPLVIWLKPHMIPDLLGVPVSAEFLAQSPTIGSSSGKGREKMDTGDGKGRSRRKRGEAERKMDTTGEG